MVLHTADASGLSVRGAALVSVFVGATLPPCVPSSFLALQNECSCCPPTRTAPPICTREKHVAGASRHFSPALRSLSNCASVFHRAPVTDLRVRRRGRAPQEKGRQVLMSTYLFSHIYKGGAGTKAVYPDSNVRAKLRGATLQFCGGTLLQLMTRRGLTARDPRTLSTRK